MQLVEKYIIKKSDDRFVILDNICFRSKNLYNATLYAVRQHFFEDKKHLAFPAVWNTFKNSNQADYIALPRKVRNFRSAQNILVNADIGALNILRKAIPKVTFASGIKVCSTPIVINSPFNSGVFISIKDIYSETYTRLGV